MRSLLILLLASSAFAQSNSERRAAWNRPQEPFRIAGNVYYVGAAGVSSFLIHTPEGSFLIDGGLEETAPQIVRNIQKLGFSIRDVKYLLNSHAHYDHSGGLALLKERSGARLLASAGDRADLESGHQSIFSGGKYVDMQEPPVHVSRVVATGDKITLGGTTLTAHITPGHTPGCTTWTTTVAEGSRTLNVVFYCSTSVVAPLKNNPLYPTIVADYEKSFAELKKLPCDVFLVAHPEFFAMEAKRRAQQQGKADAFVDPGEMQRFVAQSEADFRKALAGPSK